MLGWHEYWEQMPFHGVKRGGSPILHSFCLPPFCNRIEPLASLKSCRIMNEGNALALLRCWSRRSRRALEQCWSWAREHIFLGNARARVSCFLPLSWAFQPSVPAILDREKFTSVQCLPYRTYQGASPRLDGCGILSPSGSCYSVCAFVHTKLHHTLLSTTVEMCLKQRLGLSFLISTVA